MCFLWIYQVYGEKEFRYRYKILNNFPVNRSRAMFEIIVAEVVNLIINLTLGSLS